ncbi:sulfatase [Candidatus Neomarinimicrobiota bacterium]
MKKFSRRQFLKSTGRGALGLAGAAFLFNHIGCSAKRSGKRPNILFAFADDQSWLHTSTFGDKVVKTPAFDRIADEGVLFTHSFTACPSCTPSRSAVLTGQDIWRLREAGVLFGSLPVDLKLYPLMLEDAGYHVGYTGKGWLPGDCKALGLTRYPIGKEYNRRLEGVVARGIDGRNYSANFKDFLADRPEGTPFCFWFGSTEPHRGYEKGIGRMSGKRLEDVEVPSFWPDVKEVRDDILDYYYEIEWFDSHLASMIAKIEEIGELSNTLIVVTSDNGMPFPRAKTTLYDWGTRMPLAIRWDDKVAGGRKIDDFVSHTDFAPTFLEAAGIEIPREMTGRSLVPVLLSGKEGIVDSMRDRVFTAIERHTWCRPNGATYPVRAIRTREFLYMRNYEPERWPTGGPTFVSSNKTSHGDVDACPTKSFMVDEANQSRFAEQYRLCFGKRPAEELYKISDDPGQIHNLAGDPAYMDTKESLTAELEEYLTRTGDPRIEGHDPWQGYIYHQIHGYGARFNMSLSAEERARAILRPGN